MIPAAWSVLFPVVICVTSILGGIWDSDHNRVPRRGAVLGRLAVATLGVAAVGFGHPVTATVIGAPLAGSVPAPLATSCSLVLDRLVVPEHRASMRRTDTPHPTLTVRTAEEIIVAGTAGPASSTLEEVPCLGRRSMRDLHPGPSA